jgi:hypothetical protein
MESIKEIVSKHPVPVALAGIALVAIIMLRGTGQGASVSAQDSANLAAQENTNATNVQLAGISAQAQAALAQTNNQAATAQYEAGASLAAQQSDDIMQTVLGILSSNNTIAQVNASQNIASQQIAASVQEHASDNATQIQSYTDSLLYALSPQATNNINAQNNASNINAEAALALAQSKANVNNSQATSNNVNAGLNAFNDIFGGLF